MKASAEDYLRELRAARQRYVASEQATRGTPTTAAPRTRISPDLSRPATSPWLKSTAPPRPLAGEGEPAPTRQQYGRTTTAPAAPNLTSPLQNITSSPHAASHRQAQSAGKSGAVQGEPSAAALGSAPPTVDRQRPAAEADSDIDISQLTDELSVRRQAAPHGGGKMGMLRRRFSAASSTVERSWADFDSGGGGSLGRVRRRSSVTIHDQNIILSGISDDEADPSGGCSPGRIRTEAGPVRVESDGSVTEQLEPSRADTSAVSTVYTEGASTVHTEGASTVHTEGASTVHTEGASTVHTEGASSVHTEGASTVHTEGASTVHTEGASTVHTEGASSVHSVSAAEFSTIQSEASTALSERPADGADAAVSRSSTTSSDARRGSPSRGGRTKTARRRSVDVSRSRPGATGGDVAESRASKANNRRRRRGLSEVKHSGLSTKHAEVDTERGRATRYDRPARASGKPFPDRPVQSTPEHCPTMSAKRVSHRRHKNGRDTAVPGAAARRPRRSDGAVQCEVGWAEPEPEERTEASESLVVSYQRRVAVSSGARCCHCQRYVHAAPPPITLLMPPALGMTTSTTVLADYGDDPAMTALLVQQIALTRHFLAMQRRMHSAYSRLLRLGRHQQYTSRDDLQESRHRGVSSIDNHGDKRVRRRGTAGGSQPVVSEG